MDGRTAFDRARRASTTYSRWEIGKYVCHADWNGIYWAVTIWRGDVWQHVIWCYSEAQAARRTMDALRMLIASKGELCLSMELTHESLDGSLLTGSVDSVPPSSSFR